MSIFDYFFYGVIILVIGVAIYFLYEKSGFQLTCIISDVNGKKYCVRERTRLKEAANLLAETTEKCKQLIVFLETNYADDDRTQRLVSRFDPDKIGETLPTSQYTAYSENKGEVIKFCLNENKSNNDDLIDAHTLMFVALHEISHVATVSIGHKTEFWDNFQWILERAKEANIHNPVDYSKTQQQYCGMKINSSPYFR